MIRVQAEDFDVGEEYRKLTDGLHSMGAAVAFVGRVRDYVLLEDGEKNDETLFSMTLEHYEGMTQKELSSIEAQARERWSLLDCLIVHRYGRLTPGDQIVLVLTASKHRQDAFESAQFLMDWLKTRAPFWKLEETASGEHWVEARSADDDAAKKWS